MQTHPFFGKKVVYKFPHQNKTCFRFYSAFELTSIVRLATKQEIIFGQRVDPDFLSLDKGDKMFIEVKEIIKYDEELNLIVGELFNSLDYYENKIIEIKNDIAKKVEEFFG
jgi:hypothetical protein